MIVLGSGSALELNRGLKMNELDLLAPEVVNIPDTCRLKKVYVKCLSMKTTLNVVEQTIDV